MPIFLKSSSLQYLNLLLVLTIAPYLFIALTILMVKCFSSFLRSSYNLDNPLPSEETFIPSVKISMPLSLHWFSKSELSIFAYKFGSICIYSSVNSLVSWPILLIALFEWIMSLWELFIAPICIIVNPEIRAMKMIVRQPPIIVPCFSLPLI